MRQLVHCSVDETGQDTLGQLFIVSAHIDDGVQDALDQVRRILEKLEREAGKNALKWVRARDATRVAYMKAVLETPELSGKMYYAVYTNTKDYLRKTVITTSAAIQKFASGDDYKATVAVDGLPKSVINQFAVSLRKLHIRTKTDGVRGVRDQVDPLIRLADALCGFTRGAIEGRPEFVKLLDKARADGIIHEL